jgi:hypothetical protein
MLSQSGFENDRASWTSVDIKNEIHKRDSSLRKIYEKRLQLAVRLEENLALHRAISLRHRHAMMASVERSKSAKLAGRVR